MTLRQITPSKTALIIIDMQRDFCDPRGYAAKAGIDIARVNPVIENIKQILESARSRGLLIAHTREGHLPDLSDCPAEKILRSKNAGAEIGSMGPLGRLLVRGEYGHDFIDDLKPLPNEVIIDKPMYGAFYKTNLEEELVSKGIDTILLCGVTTEVCVHSTLREAVDRGYRCHLINDACASSDPALQQPALEMLLVEGGIFGEAVSSQNLLTALNLLS